MYYETGCTYTMTNPIIVTKPEGKRVDVYKFKWSGFLGYTKLWRNGSFIGKFDGGWYAEEYVKMLASHYSRDYIIAWD